MNAEQKLILAVVVGFMLLLLLPALVNRPRAGAEQWWPAPPGQYGLPHLRLEAVQETGGFFVNTGVDDAYLRFRCGRVLPRSLRVRPTPGTLNTGNGTAWVYSQFDVAWTTDAVVITAPRAVQGEIVVPRETIQRLRPCL